MAKLTLRSAALGFVLWYLWSPLIEGCTSILVARGAAAGGATMTSQTNDCNECDFRIARVPAMKHAPGSQRALYSGREAYPRFIGKDRGPTYQPELVDTSVYPWKEGEGAFAVMATVPQVSETYAYFDGSYGIMNEWGLSMGESTCGSLLTAASVAAGGKAKFDIRELNRVAMERCRTALCAVELMGQLATTHGYFGADTTQSEGGESLQIADPQEAWVFQISADDTGASAVWVARRVPHGHVTVVCNQFTIRRLILSDPDNFRYSDNIHDVAKRAGLWSQAEHGYPLDFTATFALNRGMQSNYATRRMWRIMSLSAPSVDLPADTTVFADDYPFSLPPDQLLKVEDITTMLRDHYEGTPFDMTKGMDAGPYGDPSRFDPGSTFGVYPAKEAVTNAQAWEGRFERAISIFRCAHSFVTQTRADAVGLDLIWFGAYAPHASQYVPMYINAGEVPAGFDHASLYSYDNSASYWVHAAVGNWADRFYRFTIGEIKKLQADLEGALYEAQPGVEAKAAALLASGDRIGASALLARHSAEASELEVATWGKFFHKLIAKYKDGQRLDNIHEQYTLNPTGLFYPLSWLEGVGFYNAGGPPTTTLAAWQGGSAAAPQLLAAVVAGMLGLLIGRMWGGRAAAGTPNLRDRGDAARFSEPLLA